MLVVVTKNRHNLTVDKQRFSEDRDQSPDIRQVVDIKKGRIETLVKTVKQPMQQSTLAKSAFTKQAYYLSRVAGSMVNHGPQVQQAQFSKEIKLDKDLTG